MNDKQTSVAIYDDTVVRQFSLMAVVWGVVGMLVGLFIAAQLAWPELNFGIPWLSYGRLRPLHTNAVIFAFGGCALIGSSYYVVQRTCHVPLFAAKLASFTFWGWQAVIVAAASVYLVYVLEILKFRRLDTLRLRRASPERSEAEIDRDVAWRLETGEFESVRPEPEPEPEDAGPRRR